MRGATRQTSRACLMDAFTLRECLLDGGRAYQILEMYRVRARGSAKFSRPQNLKACFQAFTGMGIGQKVGKQNCFPR